MSLSGAAADEWIAANPGTEGLLALGMANRIVSQGGYQGADRDAWAASLEPFSAGAVAAQTGVAAATIQRLADTFAETRPSLAIGGDAAGRHSNGVGALTAVYALNYLVGNLGMEGGLVFNPEPPAGQGAEARQASYRSMLALAEDARQGRIQVLILNQANPVFTLPEASGFKEALAEIPLIVSLSSFLDETTAMADLILPSHTYLESWGDNFPEPGVGFRAGAVAQPVVSPLYNTRAVGDTVLALAEASGLGGALPWASMDEYLQERWREIYARDAAGGEPENFEDFWNAVLKAGVWGENTRREAASPAVASGVIDSIGVPTPEFSGSSDVYPFLLQPYLSYAFHDGRGANLPWMQELPDPITSVVYGSWLEMNPTTAEELELRDGDVVEIESPHGAHRGARTDLPGDHAPCGGDAHRPGSQRVRPLRPRARRQSDSDPLPQMESATGSLAWNATRVRLAPTGRRMDLVRTSGVSRDLGREIIQTTGSGQNASAGLHSIPVTVVPA